MASRRRQPPRERLHDRMQLPSSIFPTEEPGSNTDDIRRCGNLYSEAEVIKVLAEYIGEICSTRPLKMDHRFSNCHIGLGGSACAIGLYASLGLKFPEHKTLLWASIILHFACLLVWSCIDYFILRSTILTFYSHSGTRFSLNIVLERSTGDLSISLRPFSCPINTNTVTVTRSLGEYFYETGELDCHQVFEDVRKIYADTLFAEDEVEMQTTSPTVAATSHTERKRRSKKKA